jgi:hypothetical protein
MRPVRSPLYTASLFSSSQTPMIMNVKSEFSWKAFRETAKAF